MVTVPVARPLLPSTAALSPYLRLIDESRIYSNFGPLVLKLEARIANRLAVDPACLVTVANATVGITLALQAVLEGRQTTHGYCVIPSWTFVATAHAVVAAGLTPFLIDVDEESWQISPQSVIAVQDRIDKPILAVVPVAPFGYPADVKAWDRFTEKTDIPVVIDAAAAYDSVEVGETPSVVSLHATKVLTAGEGGFVASWNSGLVRDVKMRSNFGFCGSRSAHAFGTNGKMSEYHAAVALASFDAYDETRRRLQQTSLVYRELLADSNVVSFQNGFGSDWVSSVCVTRLSHYDQTKVACHLASHGIDTRQWWGMGVHDHPAFSRLPRSELSATKTLSAETLGLPFFSDMSRPTLKYVCDHLLEALER